MVRRLILFAPALLLLAGCPKPRPPPQEVPDEQPAHKEVIGVEGVGPNSTPQGRAVTVTVTGFGFVTGTDVFLDSHRVPGIDIVSEGELTFRATDDLSAGTYDVRLETPEGDVAVARAAFSVKAPPVSSCDLQTIYFDFDDAALRNESREILAANAACISERGMSGVRLEGHADERGSTVYNLSLGQRRADSVRQYLVNLGLDGSTIQTLSYGEERPEVRGSNEAAWSRNRRVVFVAR